jgi:hypothetical protein
MAEEPSGPLDRAERLIEASVNNQKKLDRLVALLLESQIETDKLFREWRDRNEGAH